MKFYVYEKTLLDKDEIKQIINDFEKDGFVHTKNLNEAEYVFVFGGDGTFLSALKEFLHLDIKIVLFNVGRLGFLSSIDETIGLDSQEAYTNFDYLSINTNKDQFICINEMSILIDKLSIIKTNINELEFKTLMSNQINVVNNLGSTGINRSNLKPLLFPWNHQFIIDVKNEPIYNYYQPLLQPFVLTQNDKIQFIFENKNYHQLKIDNKLFNINDNDVISVEQKRSKCKVLNLCQPKTFFNKINKLF